MTVNIAELFNCKGDGSAKPNYPEIERELERLRQINDGFFVTYDQKAGALFDTGRIAVGLFNRAELLDGNTPDNPIFPSALHEVNCSYLKSRGWSPSETHPAWWKRGPGEDYPLASALHVQYCADGVDMRS